MRCLSKRLNLRGNQTPNKDLFVPYLQTNNNQSWLSIPTCRVTFLKDTCGKSAWPSNCSGKGMGRDTRRPSLKRLTVLTLGLVGSRFKRIPRTWSRMKRSATVIRCLLLMKQPSESKQTESSVSPRKRLEFCLEKPMRHCCRGIG